MRNAILESYKRKTAMTNELVQKDINEKEMKLVKELSE